MNSQLALGLRAAPRSDTVVINARCTFRMQEEQRVVVVRGLLVYHYCAADPVAEAYAMVMLVESGFAQQTEVAQAFGKSERSVRRYQERYGQAGMSGLGRPGGWRRGRRRISGKRLRLIERLKSETDKWTTGALIDSSPIWGCSMMRRRCSGMASGSLGLDLSPDGHEIWTASSASGQIYVIDTTAQKVSQVLDAKARTEIKTLSAPEWSGSNACVYGIPRPWTSTVSPFPPPSTT